MKRHALAALLALTAAPAVAADPHTHPMPTQDTRAFLDLSAAERAALLEEMHLFLDGVGRITAAIAKADMQAVAAVARPLGPQMSHTMPASLRGKLPMPFREHAQGLHGAFAEMALDAESLNDPNHALAQLAATLQKCSACHRTYQIRVVDGHVGH